jgi:diaminopimelate epimerase
MEQRRERMNRGRYGQLWLEREFFKFSGSGNDFIIMDNRDGAISGADIAAEVALLCRRKTSIGADGLILIENSSSADFAWRFFNADGGEAEMCGNGGRCAARFAFMQGIAGKEMSFQTRAGIIRASILDSRRVKLQMPTPHSLRLDYEIDLGQGKSFTVSSINTGVPHVVLFTEDLEACPVAFLGRAIRYHPYFEPAGTNANFVCTSGTNRLSIRTYERGVEDETLACGTGSVAAALVAARKGLVSSPVSVLTRGGERLAIHFNLSGDEFGQVFLEGDTSLIFSGHIKAEAFAA